MTVPTESPAPRQLSDGERALWEKAQESIAGDEAVERYLDTAYREYSSDAASARFLVAHNARQALASECTPAVILSLLTALSTAREAGERDTARLDWMIANHVTLKRMRDEGWYYAVIVNGNHVAHADHGDLRAAIDAALTSTEPAR